MVTEAQKKGLPLYSEIDLALANYHGDVIAVTGTNGKSTTVTMVAHLLQELGYPASLAGNIGCPPSTLVAEKSLADTLVLELSSYQLESSRPIKAKIVIFTSLSPDHLEHHGTLKDYYLAKWRLFAALPRGAIAIMPAAVWRIAQSHDLLVPKHVTLDILADSGAKSTYSDLPGSAFIYTAGSPGLQLPTGKNLGTTSLQKLLLHDRCNASLSAIAVARLLGLALEQVLTKFENFDGLEHRCQRLGTVKGYPFYNDSKSTNVASTLTALQAMDQPVHLLLGGLSKGESFAPLLAERRKIKMIYLFGASRDAIKASLDGFPISGNFPTLSALLENLPSIFEQHPGPILFSPGCASFDEFDNFEERGKFFHSYFKTHLKLQS